MILVLLGPPGSGKGTQSQTIVDKLSVIQISTGEILRNAVKEGTELGKTAKEYIDAGNLVPDEVMIGIIQERIVQEDCANGFILDGFPRTIEQAEALDQLLKKNGRELSHVIYLDVPEKELIVRLLKRSEIEGRADDNLNTIKNRLDQFKKKTLGLINYYKEKNKLVYIDGTGEQSDVTARLTRVLEA